MGPSRFSTKRIDSGLLIAHVVEHQGVALSDLMTILSKESGLKGICGENDLRDIHRRIAAGDDRARLALEMLVYRYKHYVGAYLAVLEKTDAVVFTAGIGENDPIVRQGVCDGLKHLGIYLDQELNYYCIDQGVDTQASTDHT